MLAQKQSTQDIKLKRKEKVTFDKKTNNYNKNSRKTIKNTKDQKNKEFLEENEKKTTKNVNLYHEALGHPSEGTTSLTAKFYNVNLTRNWKI